MTVKTNCDMCKREIPEGELRTLAFISHQCKDCLPISLWKRIKFKIFG
jgi:hypothetical protein